jgi:hypothetical protein
MLTDRYGLPVSTASTAARDALVEGIDLLLAAGPGPADAFQRAIDADAGFVLAHLGKARALQVRGDLQGAVAASATPTRPATPSRRASRASATSSGL